MQPSTEFAGISRISFLFLILSSIGVLIVVVIVFVIIVITRIVSILLLILPFLLPFRWLRSLLK